jgi:hypothetical protein
MRTPPAYEVAGDALGVSDVGGGLDAAAIREAVKAPFVTMPTITTDSPGLNWAAVAGAFFVPNCVCGVMVTVSV